MKTVVKQIYGNWDIGYVLDKHTISSVPIGEDAYGHMQFDTTRTEVGEALYQLKYKSDWSQVDVLAKVLATTIYPRLKNVGLIIPMPGSNQRARQPVKEMAHALAKVVKLTCFDDLLIKSFNGKSLKNLETRIEKEQAIKGTLSIKDTIENKGKWNALLIDDLYHTGATMNAACDVLRDYEKIEKIYVATVTWR